MRRARTAPLRRRQQATPHKPAMHVAMHVVHEWGWLSACCPAPPVTMLRGKSWAAAGRMLQEAVRPRSQAPRRRMHKHKRACMRFRHAPGAAIPRRVMSRNRVDSQVARSVQWHGRAQAPTILASAAGSRHAPTRWCAQGGWWVPGHEWCLLDGGSWVLLQQHRRRHRRKHGRTDDACGVATVGRHAGCTRSPTANNCDCSATTPGVMRRDEKKTHPR